MEINPFDNYMDNLYYYKFKNINFTSVKMYNRRSTNLLLQKDDVGMPKPSVRALP